ncbi:hypothetical protein E5C26_11890 [Serratia proteamaculans]|uniref:hypothetical protein n=1 Tax=Serratia proteamaculans TaxID=28151 RepID=UPI001075EEDA|nr:hypothetical protein [Serratia proteamaculans]TFZ51058.1 hypothetical protein E5C26_11890 [Serratia proteamaculans]
MAIYRVNDNEIIAVERTTFDRLGVRERQDLQSMLKRKIQVLSPNIMVVAEEFGEWEDSRRRIDLLGIDKSANLVVIELKRTEDGGHMELQALRYAAMISTITFDKLVNIFAKYLQDNDSDKEPRQTLLDFLEWESPDEDEFAQEVKIILASAEFSKELTTTVIWLNDYGLDIRCVRMRPYLNDDQVLIDIQTVIPIPEAADYQIKIREKKQKEREARTLNRDITKYDLTIGDVTFSALSKRWLVFHTVKAVFSSGVTPAEIMALVPERGERLFEVLDGELKSDEVCIRISGEDSNTTVPRAKRFFTRDEELFYWQGKTFALSNQWGVGTVDSMSTLASHFPHLKIAISTAEA